MTIKKERVYPYPPEKLWKALTDPAALSSWLMLTNFKAEVGQQFYFDACNDDIITGEVLEIVPMVKLVYSWIKKDLENTTVTWSLEGTPEGTVLRMEHAGFDLAKTPEAASFDSHNEGWGALLNERLEKYLTK